MQNCGESYLSLNLNQLSACLVQDLANRMFKIFFYLVVLITTLDGAKTTQPIAASSLAAEAGLVSQSEAAKEVTELKPHGREEKSAQKKGSDRDNFQEDHDHNNVDYEEEELYSEEANDSGVREPRQKKLRGPRQAAGLTCYGGTGNITKGTCMQWQACQKIGGNQGANCAGKGIVCCSTEKTCHGATDKNNTQFINPGYPKADSGTGACSLTINRLNNNICQMRFDFITMELSQPDADGNCVTDFLTVTQGTYAAPIICGSNSGQHMYVDVDPEGGAVRLTVDRTAASMSQRMWSIEVTQIECTSKYKAPAGCLQYFTETSGTVNSFNFKQEIEERSVPQTTRQIVDMSYAVCIKAADGYCSVMWTRNVTGGDYAFSVSANIAAMADTLIGDPAASSIGGKCTTDYVVLPGGVDDRGTKNDRFCGAGFPNWVTTNMRPFIMFVKTDKDEKFDVLNRGFSLDYRQTIC